MIVLLWLCVLSTVLNLTVSEQNATSIQNVSINDYQIHYNRARSTLRTHPIGQEEPVTVIDLSSGQFVYILDNNCYVGRTREQPRRQIAMRANRNWDIEGAIRKLLGQYRVFYADGPLSGIQVHKLLRSELRKDCESRRVWTLKESKPKLETFGQFLETNERKRTGDFSRLETEVKRRTRRNVKRVYGRRKNQSAVNTPTGRYRKHKWNPYFQADESSSGKVVIADGVSYVSPSFNPNLHERSGFRHYKDFNNEENIVDSGRDPVDQYYDPASNMDPMNVQFPKTIMKDGQVFHRHDATDKDENKNLIGLTEASVVPQTITQETMPFHLPQDTDKSSMPMPRGFDRLMDHVRLVGAQHPIISAAIAGASIRGSGKESSSHVIGSAINGGYFAASAQGYDGKGGTIHSHVQGTADGVNGGASAIAPDKKGEAFIQVDHSERGLSIGHSSTQNGEAFVLADVDRQSERQLQHGDSTSFYSDTYNTKQFGHTFGEAKSHISSESKPRETKRMQQFDNGLPSSQSQRSVGLNMLDGIMEQVLQPDIVQPTISSVENTYFTESYPVQGNEYSEYTTEARLGDASTQVRDGSQPSISAAGDTAEVINRHVQVKDSKGVVGLATYPYGQVGIPPGPGELLTTQVPHTDELTFLSSEPDDELSYSDYSYTDDNNIKFNRKSNGETQPIPFDGIVVNDNSNQDLEGSTLNKMPKFHLSNMPVHNIYNDMFEKPVYSNNVFDEYNQTEDDKFPQLLNIPGTTQSPFAIPTSLPTHYPGNSFYHSNVDADLSLQTMQSPIDQQIPLLHSHIDKQTPLLQPQIVQQTPIMQLPVHHQTPLLQSHIDQQTPLFKSPDQQIPLFKSTDQQIPPLQSHIQQTPLLHSPIDQQTPFLRSHIDHQTPLFKSPDQQTPLFKSPDQQIPLFKSTDQQIPPLQSPIQQTPLLHSPIDQQTPLLRSHIDQQTPLFKSPDEQIPLLQLPSYQPTTLPPLVTTTFTQYDDVNQRTYSPRVNASFVDNGVITGTVQLVDTSGFDTGYRQTIIQPGRPGETQVYEPSLPGQPVVNIVTMDKGGRRNSLYQQDGEPIGPGETIPGLPGYRVPTGFRGKVIYGDSLPVNLNSRKTVQGYNTRVTVQRQNSQNGEPLYAFISGPHSNLQSQLDQTPGIYIALNSYQKPHPSQAVIHQQPQNVAATSRQSVRRGPPTSSTATRSSLRTWPANQRSRSRENNQGNENGDNCGYYTKDCETMDGPYKKLILCVPKFVVVACCC